MERIVERDFPILECSTFKTPTSAWALETGDLFNMEMVETPNNAVFIRASDRWHLEAMDPYTPKVSTGQI
jgi:hypothetical protein